MLTGMMLVSVVFLLLMCNSIHVYGQRPHAAPPAAPPATGPSQLEPRERAPPATGPSQLEPREQAGLNATAPMSGLSVLERGDSCEPSYPDVCIPPHPPDLNCDDFSYKNIRVLTPDPHGLDGNDSDGIGCET